MKPSIEILEGVSWPEPELPTSGLVLRTHALRKKPIDELTADDLRTAFGQDIGTPFLIKRVLEVLTADPAAGDLYDGDLIHTLIRSRLVREDAAFRSQVMKVAEAALRCEIDGEVRDAIIKAKAAEPNATDNPDDAQRLREDH